MKQISLMEQESESKLALSDAHRDAAIREHEEQKLLQLQQQAPLESQDRMVPPLPMPYPL